MVRAGVFLQQCLLIMVKFFGFRAELENQAPIKICAEIGYYTNIYIYIRGGGIGFCGCSWEWKSLNLQCGKFNEWRQEGQMQLQGSRVCKVEHDSVPKTKRRQFDPNQNQMSSTVGPSLIRYHSQNFHRFFFYIFFIRIHI